MTSRPTVEEINQIVADVHSEQNKIDLVVVGLTHHSQIAVVNQLATQIKKPVVAISFGSPFYFKQMNSGVGTLICSYGTERELLQSTAKILVGLIKPQGKLPVVLHPQPHVQSTMVKQ